MKMMTKETKRAMPAFGKGDRSKCIVKFFTPWSNWTWYVTEGERQENGDWLFYGLVEGFESEWGYFLLSELESVRGPLGLKIERDRYFSAPVPEVA